jgi:hypothetical protein
LKNLGVDKRIILKRILKKGARKFWSGGIWLRIGISVGLL